MDRQPPEQKVVTGNALRGFRNAFLPSLFLWGLIIGALWL
jgi:hypothetical protein